MTRMPTLADVAARAGVSSKTVSRVVSGEPHVSAKARQKVEAAVAELDYRLNHAARSLASSRSYFIGIVTGFLSSSYLSELHRSALQACRARGFHLAIEELVRDDRSMEEFERRLRHVRYDGVILVPPVSDDGPTLDLLDRFGIPYVRLAPVDELGRSHSIFANDENGAQQIARHFVSLGHRKVGVLQGPPGFHSSAARENAFTEEFVRLGGAPDAVRVAAHEWAGTAIRSGGKAARSLLMAADPPTAIFAYNDEMAAGAMACAREMGLSIPEDVAIAGFDDSEAAAMTWPALTTVRQPLKEIAAEAVDLLTGTQPAMPVQQIRLPVELVVRGSTDKSRLVDDI